MKDAFYFPHFCNARHDRKLKRVRKELGVEGYGIFFMVLEVLREQRDYKYPLEDIDLLADEFGTSEQKLRTVVSNYQLFEVDEKEKFFSSNLIKNLQPYLEGKKNKQISGIRGNLIRYKYISKDESDNMNPEEIMQKYYDLGMGSHSDSLAIAIKESKESKVKKVNIDYSLSDTIIDYYNNITGQKRRYSKTSRDPIHARLNENYSIDDCKKVINTKYNEWKDNEEMQEYITIETFFRPTKFEKYLNQKAESSTSEATKLMMEKAFRRG